MKKIALTGNMGSGKSYAGHLIAGFGVFVLDIDEVAKQVRETHTQTLLDQFSVNTPKALSDLIFEHPQKREQLENFMYRYMLEQMEAFFKKHCKEILCVVEVPLLFEKGWEKYFDEVWCVVSSKEIALVRLQKDRGIKESEALRRWVHQMDMDEKAKRSTHILYNNENDNIELQIMELLNKEGYHVEEGKFN